MGRRLFDKVWSRHVVRPETAEVPAVLYVDLHLVHEVTSPQAFATMRRRGLTVRRADRTVATMDHSIPTSAPDAAGDFRFVTPAAQRQVEQLEANCEGFGIDLFRLGDERRGIVHVIGPELGLTLPGMTIVCGDSHTATHGAFGALAFGIGTSEVGHVLATQCLLQRRPRTMGIRVDSVLGREVSAKDLILAIIAQIGVDGATEHAIEYCGRAIESLTMEERMTVCNMSIEAGGRCGLIAPDDTTFEYLAGRPHAPSGRAWDDAVAGWRELRTDDPGDHDRCFSLDASTVEPMITYGTNPGMAVPIGAAVPQGNGGMAHARALQYMGLRPGEKLLGKPVDVVFIGSCTNARISDLRLAARRLDGRRVASSTRLLVVPGSQAVKREAEDEGLDRIFRAAGAEWREAGCSMCLAMNGDRVGAGELAVSTGNRNFEGRQGPGARTLLASPATAAACAVAGRVADPRELFDEQAYRLSSGRRGLAPGRNTQAREARHASAGSTCREGRGSDPARAWDSARPRPSRTMSRGGRGVELERTGRRAMDGLIELTTRFVVLEGDNIDTDRIIPARFLTSTSRDGIGKGLFADWRRDEAGNPRPDFALHRPEAEGAEALVVGRNFGCGSSREHAAWALRDNGFRVIIGTELADIFRANALKNGLLCVQVSEPVHERLVRQGSGSIEVSVERRVLRLEDGFETVFPLDPFARHCLMEGIDDLRYLLQQGETIAAFERRRESAGVGPGERVPRTNRVELEESAGVGHESRAPRRDGAEVPGVGGRRPRGRT